MSFCAQSAMPAATIKLEWNTRMLAGLKLKSHLHYCGYCKNFSLQGIEGLIGFELKNSYFSMDLSLLKSSNMHYVKLRFKIKKSGKFKKNHTKTTGLLSPLRRHRKVEIASFSPPLNNSSRGSTTYSERTFEERNVTTIGVKNSMQHRWDENIASRSSTTEIADEACEAFRSSCSSEINGRKNLCCENQQKSSNTGSFSFDTELDDVSKTSLGPYISTIKNAVRLNIRLCSMEEQQQGRCINKLSTFIKNTMPHFMKIIDIVEKLIYQEKPGLPYSEPKNKMFQERRQLFEKNTSNKPVSTTSDKPTNSKPKVSWRLLKGVWRMVGNSDNCNSNQALVSKGIYPLTAKSASMCLPSGPSKISFYSEEPSETYFLDQKFWRGFMEKQERKQWPLSNAQGQWTELVSSDQIARHHVVPHPFRTDQKNGHLLLWCPKGCRPLSPLLQQKSLGYCVMWVYCQAVGTCPQRAACLEQFPDGTYAPTCLREHDGACRVATWRLWAAPEHTKLFQYCANMYRYAFFRPRSRSAYLSQTP